MTVSCITYYATLNIEAACSSYRSGGFQWTTKCYIPEDRTLCKFTSFCVVMKLDFSYMQIEVVCYWCYAVRTSVIKSRRTEMALHGRDEKYVQYISRKT
jgi:hypothetical protein